MQAYAVGVRDHVTAFRCAAEVRGDVWEQVEGTSWRWTSHVRDGIDEAQRKIAFLLELGNLAIDILHGALQRSNSGVLGDTSCAGRDLALQLGRRLHYRLRRSEVAQTITRHRESLRKPVDGQCAAPHVRQGRERDVLHAVVADALVDLVGEHEHVVILGAPEQRCYGLELILSHSAPCGVRGVAQDEHAGARFDDCCQSLGVNRVALRSRRF
mmetsp:Transcript_112980/g.319566  ORF Transcript_112980/g.319566 Transcript_112980/m.319566 type:complete len:213 (+) Transcript_112980:272-910(+)